VQYMVSVFEDCIGLNNHDKHNIRNWNISNVTNAENIFNRSVIPKRFSLIEWTFKLPNNNKVK